MSAFKYCLERGQKAEDLVGEWITKQFEHREDFEGLEFGRSVAEQKVKGDIGVILEDTEYNVEVKMDGNSKYGNVVMETESNKGKTPGWLHGYEEVTHMAYLFEDTGWMLWVRWKDLQKFVLDSESVWRKVNQNKYKQANVPVNYLVPYERIFNEVKSAKKIQLIKHGE